MFLVVEQLGVAEAKDWAAEQGKYRDRVVGAGHRSQTAPQSPESLGLVGAESAGDVDGKSNGLKCRGID